MFRRFIYPVVSQLRQQQHRNHVIAAVRVSHPAPGNKNAWSGQHLPLLSLPSVRFKTSQKSKKSKKAQAQKDKNKEVSPQNQAPRSELDELLDEFSDSDSDTEDEERLVKGLSQSPVAVFIQDLFKHRHEHGKHHHKDHTGKHSKAKDSHVLTLSYPQAMDILDVESYWQIMQNEIDGMQDYFIHHLTVRSAAALDDVPVTLEGDLYPLREVASISRKDPKRLIVDCSSFPQASADIFKAIQSSGMNLNPQQDGTRIYVPIPKVTKEHRENLAKGAKLKLGETKEKLRHFYNDYLKELDYVLSDKASGGISIDEGYAMRSLLKNILDHFGHVAEELTHKKKVDIKG